MKKKNVLAGIILITILIFSTACHKEAFTSENLTNEETLADKITYNVNDETSDVETTTAETEPESIAAVTEEAAEALTEAKTEAPTQTFTVAPTQASTVAPTQASTVAPTQASTVAPTVAPTQAPTDTNYGGITSSSVYNAMIAFKTTYPEGTPLTNESFYYSWKGGIYSGGYGCAGFAFMLSDAAFGDLPVREYTDISQIRIGDIIRINHDTHSVIVLAIDSTGITIAEGNYNSSVHWGRTITYNELAGNSYSNDFTYGMTRYPE